MFARAARQLGNSAVMAAAASEGSNRSNSLAEKVRALIRTLWQ